MVGQRKRLWVLFQEICWVKGNRIPMESEDFVAKTLTRVGIACILAPVKNVLQRIGTKREQLFLVYLDGWSATSSVLHERSSNS
jgi:hypothetical protein